MILELAAEFLHDADCRIAAASPSGQNVRPNIFFERSPIMSMSSGRPQASVKTIQVFSSQLVLRGTGCTSRRIRAR